MKIKDWPATEQPRKRLIEFGAQSLSDAELLAVLIGTGRNGRNAIDLARDLITRFDGLRGLLKTDSRTLQRTAGLGPAKSAQLVAVRELSRRFMDSKLRRQRRITNPSDTKSFLIAWLRDQPQEVFGCVYLDNRHRVICSEALFRGTIDGASIYPREVVRRCLEVCAAAVIFAHNHPSGIAEPSEADRRITLKLRDALAMVDVRVLDHMVIGDGIATSLAERGTI